MTQRLFLNFNFVKMASPRYHATVTPSTRPYEHLHVARERCVATVSVPQVNGIMMFIFGMQMMVQAQYNVRIPCRLRIEKETSHDLV